MKKSLKEERSQQKYQDNFIKKGWQIIRKKSELE